MCTDGALKTLTQCQGSRKLCATASLCKPQEVREKALICHLQPTLRLCVNLKVKAKAELQTAGELKTCPNTSKKSHCKG